MPVSGAMAENATLFVVYNQVQNLIRRFRTSSSTEPLSLSELALPSACAGAAASYVLTPVELIKCRMQVQLMVPPDLLKPSTSPPPGPVALARDTIRQHGFRGLWLGHTGTLLREAGGSTLWFLTFESLARAQIPQGGTKNDLAAWQLAASGACAGIAFTVGLFPADCIKSTVQVQEELNPAARRKGFIETGRDIYRSRGIRGLYNGCGVTCVRSAPSSAMIFAIYSLVRSFSALRSAHVDTRRPAGAEGALTLACSLPASLTPPTVWLASHLALETPVHHLHHYNYKRTPRQPCVKPRCLPPLVAASYPSSVSVLRKPGMHYALFNMAFAIGDMNKAHLSIVDPELQRGFDLLCLCPLGLSRSAQQL